MVTITQNNEFMDNTEIFKFWGEFEHSVDDKGRVIIPLDFREPLGDEFFVSRGPDHAIWLFPTSIWKKIEVELNDSVLQRDKAFLQRMFGGRTLVKMDPQSRLAIPKHLRDWAGVTNSLSAVIIGQGQKIEIWSKIKWDAYNESFNSNNMYTAFEAVGLPEINLS